ncbi:MAG: hypothetical protein WHS63_09460, partial [Tenuifilum sp.]|uniref:hypothetical protein n=1 Tax=Tenuifilum sp. TaxID=2760880 RepID=UPI0030AF218C
GCKGSNFFRPAQGVTPKFFFLPPSAPPPRALPSESGCKSRKAFLITQINFQNFFKKNDKNSGNVLLDSKKNF